jgi:hypothetical protein
MIREVRSPWSAERGAPGDSPRRGETARHHRNPSVDRPDSSRIGPSPASIARPDSDLEELARKRR